MHRLRALLWCWGGRWVRDRELLFYHSSMPSGSWCPKLPDSGRLRQGPWKGYCPSLRRGVVAEICDIRGGTAGRGRFGLLSRRRENRESEPIKISASDHQPQKAAGQNTRQVGTDKQGCSVSQGRECGETKEMNSLSRINRVHMWQETRRVGGESAGVGSNWKSGDDVDNLLIWSTPESGQKRSLGLRVRF